MRKKNYEQFANMLGFQMDLSSVFLFLYFSLSFFAITFFSFSAVRRRFLRLGPLATFSFSFLDSNFMLLTLPLRQLKDEENSKFLN